MIQATDLKRSRPTIAECIQLLPNYDPYAGITDSYYFDEGAAQFTIDFIETCCTHIEGDLAGQPLTLQPWQIGFVANLFGWKRDGGARRYRESLLYIGRKNGKTCLAAAIALTSMSMDGEIGAYNVCAAADADQAALLFRHADGMITNDSELSRRFKVYRGIGQRSIAYPAQSSRLKVVSSDAATKHGGNGHLAIVDELHAQKNRDLVDVLQTSMASANRRQPLLLHLTTADFDRESICNEKYDHAKRILDGTTNDPWFLPAIYEAGQDDDWTDEKTWEKANPNIDVSVSREYLHHECERAKSIVGYQNTFKRLHLNLRTQQAVRWITLESWDECAIGIDDPKSWRKNMIEELRCEPCYAALDLSTKRDLTALVLLFQCEDDSVIILPWFFCPAADIHERSTRDHVPYSEWIQDGWLEATPGNSIDQSYIRAKHGELRSMFEIKTTAFDPWNGEWFNQQVGGDDGANVVEFNQNLRNMNEPSKEFEALIIDHKLQHGANPMLRWMAGNVSVFQDGNGNIRPDKKKSTERIDGIVATIMTIGLNMKSDYSGVRHSSYANDVY